MSIRSEIPSQIFKEYDIRGIVGKELNQEVAYKLGQLFSTEVEQQSVVIGKDARLSSNEIIIGFRNGLLDSGCRVLELQELSSSPLLYFAHYILNTKAAVMITGSHNPLEYNGLKFMINKKPFYGNRLYHMRDNHISSGDGSHQYVDIQKQYIETLLSLVKITKPMKIVWDCNNGGVVDILKKITAKLPGEHILLNSDANGVFYHSQPDPILPENLLLICSRVIEEKADLGIAFDGDGDRLVIVKTNGEALTGDQLIYLMASILKNNANNRVIVDVKTNQTIINALELAKFHVIIGPAGHSLMKKNILEEDALLAAETTGHFIINDKKYFPFDDGLYSGLKIIEYLSQNLDFPALPISHIVGQYKISIANPLKQQVIDQLKQYCYEDLNSENFLFIDGIRNTSQSGYWLIRASNTEDHILVKYEAYTEHHANIIKHQLHKLLGLVKMDIQI